MSINVNFIDEEYSDVSASNISKWFDEVISEFAESSYFKEFTFEQQECAFFMLSCFFEYSYSYCLAGPGEINEGVIDEVCLDVMPRKISTEKESYELFAPVMNQFLLWCEDKGYIKNTVKISKYINKVAPRMIELSQDSCNWGMAKSMCMEGMFNVSEISNASELLNNISHIPETYQREERKIGRNELCPCGSSKKYKKCCMLEIVN